MGLKLLKLVLENPNDPCDIGECTSDGQFVEIIIDCMEEMGMPCDGEGRSRRSVLFECVEDLDCIDQDTIRAQFFLVECQFHLVQRL